MKFFDARELSIRRGRLIGFFATFPFRFVGRPEIKSPDGIAHGSWPNYLVSNFDKPGNRILEIGSRVVTGKNYRSRFKHAEYVGFDFYPGTNVDVVGDAHRLSTYFPEGEKFDLIFCSAVLEHLHMPWVFAEQVHKMLNLGGSAFVETHFSFSAHERPWNFFQFSEKGLHALFNTAMGFELVKYGMSNPIYGFFGPKANAGLRFRPVLELYCHSGIHVKKVAEPASFDWHTVELDSIVNGERYPPP